MRVSGAVVEILLCLWLGACVRHVPISTVPAGSGTVRTIKFAGGPDGTASEVLALWKARNIDFGVGKPYTREAAAQALVAVRQHYRANKIHKGRAVLELRPAPSPD
jgi:hypothetical protein